LTKLISFSLLIKVHVLLIYKMYMKINKFIQLLKQNCLGYLLIILFLGSTHWMC